MTGLGDRGSPRRVAYQRLCLASGHHDGTSTAASAGTESAEVRFAACRGPRQYADPFAGQGTVQRFCQARWSSPALAAPFPFHELVLSWQARTPGRSWLEFSVRARMVAANGWSDWLVLARWADHDEAVRPTSVPGQTASGVRVATDTVLIAGGADAWQVRAVLLRPPGEDETGPVLGGLGAMISTSAGTGTSGSPPATERAPEQVRAAGPVLEPGRAAGRVLDVPPLSQRIHAGRYPQWGGGGDGWCSPTSVTMVLSYWGRGPDPDAIAWVDPSYPDPAVYHAVRHCWDHAYSGAGNWSFNTAYAAGFGLRAFVTRLRGLAEAEQFIAAGIPLVASIQVDPTALAGADYASPGHLVVLAGFTEAGDAVVNDPGAIDPGTVRRVYRRDQFERAWLCGSGGVVYVIHPPPVALPRAAAEPNW
ncbi:MAG TPA: peptidase C39 family protein [Micromonosporaceae bacterium]